MTRALRETRFHCSELVRQYYNKFNSTLTDLTAATNLTTDTKEGHPTHGEVFTHTDALRRRKVA
jgi:hypothetical protein